MSFTTESDWTLFRATGVSHLISISGLHITLFAWIASRCLSWLWRQHGGLCLWATAPRAAAVGGLLLAALYAVFSGWGVPAQRTVLMLGTVTLLRQGGRHWPALSVWLAVAAVVVMVDPWALLQPGFWLSFVAVGVLMTSLEPPPPVTLAQSRMRRAGTALASMVGEQALVTLALAPLTLIWFGQLSVIGLLANLLAIPWVTLVVTPLAFLGTLTPPLWDLAAWAAMCLLQVLEWMASGPFVPWTLPQAPTWAGCAAVFGAWLLTTRAPGTLRLLGAGFTLPLLLWQAPHPAEGEFTLLGADVGQGQAVLVRTARHALLYDSGPSIGRHSDAGQRVIVPLLQALGVRPDMLLLSHRDNDHTGGARAVLQAFPKAGLLATLEAGHPLLDHPGAQHCHAGQNWTWDGVRFDIIHPTGLTDTATDSSNAGTCVLRVSNGKRAALLAGDIEKPQERALLSDPALLQADWLLVPHHGSRTSSTPEFLQAVQPRMALVQSGYHNRYGHPAPDVMARYVERGIHVRTSPECGAAYWSSRAPGVWQCERKVRPRYWQHRLPEPAPTPSP